MRHLAILALCIGSISLAPSLVSAQQPATTQGPSASRESLEATITGVEGLVQVRDAEDKPWRKAEVGMVLKEDAEFRTGPKSAVRFEIPPDQIVTLDRLGTVKLLEAAKQGGKIITNLGMKYGRTRYDIEAAGQEHDSKITSPSSTLAVRGTRVSLYDQRPFTVEAVSLTGRADFRDGKKQLAFGNKGQGKTKVTENQVSAAATALDVSVIDPRLPLARSQAEQTVVSTLISRGSTVAFDRASGIRVVTGGVPPTDQELIPALPGQLNFVLRWNSNADLNFSVGAPGGPNNGGEFLFPYKGLNTTRSGGRMDFDHRGGPNGGIEIAYWPGTAPQGLYGLGAVLNSGSTTTATVTAYLGGQPVQIFNGVELVNSVVTPIAPLTPGLGEASGLGIVGIGVDIPGAGGGEVVEPLSVKKKAVKSSKPTLSGSTKIQTAPAIKAMKSK